MEIPIKSSSSLSSSFASNPSYTIISVDDDNVSKKYDVFLSFRGKDTKKNILGHIKAALSEKGFKTFANDNQLTGGEHKSSELLQAIEDSSCSIVIISPNYVSSSLCLDELFHILDCMKTRGQVVIPIFYHINRSDVREQVGSFVKALSEHEKNLEVNLDRVNRWRVALTEVTSLVGLDLKSYRDEANFIREIVGEVSSKLTWIASQKILEDHQYFSEAIEVVRGVSWPIFILLIFFLVIFPLLGLFFFKIVAPTTENINGIGNTPFRSSYANIHECPEGMVPAEKSSPIYKVIFAGRDVIGTRLCAGS